jgi:hypothetical protein
MFYLDCRTWLTVLQIKGRYLWYACGYKQAFTPGHRIYGGSIGDMSVEFTADLSVI